MEKNALRVRRLMSNQVLPFRAQFIVTVHDETKEGLRSKVAALKGAVGKLGGIRYYEPSWEIATMNYYNAAIPGWSFDAYDDFTHKLDYVNLVDLLPIDGTPKGDLARAEALYDGDAGNLIGIRTFSGEVGSEMPLHSIIVGAKGSASECKTLRCPISTGRSDRQFDASRRRFWRPCPRRPLDDAPRPSRAGIGRSINK
jgi:hypothetical protein